VTDPNTVTDILGLGKVGEKSLEVVQSFLEKVFGPVASETGEALADPVRNWRKRRLERGEQILTAAAVVVEATQLDAHPVPGRVLMPLLEKASLEEDPALQARWTALLANAALQPDGVLPAFVSLLAELSPLEAKLLKRVYELCLERRYHAMPATSGSPDAYLGHHRRMNDVTRMLEDGTIMEHVGIESLSVYEVLTGNLERMALVSRRPDFGQSAEPEGNNWGLSLTPFGEAFLRACSDPDQ
jgi:hypothetical protein